MNYLCNTNIKFTYFYIFYTNNVVDLLLFTAKELHTYIGRITDKNLHALCVIIPKQ